MFDQTAAAIIVLGLFTALITSNIRPALIFGTGMTACYLTGLISTDELLHKGVNPGLATLVLLLLVSLSLAKITWINSLSSMLLNRGYRSSLVQLSLITAMLSAFINNTAVVAMMSVGINRNGKFPPSKLLLPLSYAAILGGTTTLIGTSTNLIVNSFLLDAGVPGLNFFDFFTIGSLATAAGLLAIIFSARLFPSLSSTPNTAFDYFLEARILPGSSLANKSVATNQLRNLQSLFLVEVLRGDRLLSAVQPSEVLLVDDILVFSGNLNDISRLKMLDGLEICGKSSHLLEDNLVEAIVLPEATVVGKSVKACNFRSMFDAAVVAVRRGGQPLSGGLGVMVLRPGDMLILAAGEDFYERKNLARNFIVTRGDKNPQRLSTPISIAISVAFACAIVLAALNIVSLFKALLLLLAGMLICKTISAEEIKRRFPFDIWLIVTSSLVLAQALHNSGLIETIVAGLHFVLATTGPLGALITIYLFTLLLTELMTNNAAAALAFPIAFGLAQSLAVNHLPFVMAVAYGASASFLTPYGYNTNLIVQNMCGYQLKHYLHAGLPVTLAYSTVVLILLPRVFPLH